MSVSTVSFPSAIREVLAEMPSDATPEDVADKIAGQLSPQDRKRVFMELLVPFVADVMRRERNAALSGRGCSSRSGKVSQRRSWWERVLVTRVCVGGGEWKTLGTCTVEDLEFCIAERAEQVAQLQARIVWFERVAKEMEVAGVAMLGELDESVVPRPPAGLVG